MTWGQDDTRPREQRMRDIANVKNARGVWFYVVGLAATCTAIVVAAIVATSSGNDSSYIAIAILFSIPAIFLWAMAWALRKPVWASKSQDKNEA